MGFGGGTTWVGAAAVGAVLGAGVAAATGLGVGTLVVPWVGNGKGVAGGVVVIPGAAVGFAAEALQPAVNRSSRIEIKSG